MTPAEQAAFAEQLRALRAQLTETLVGTDHQAEPVSLDLPIGRLSRVDEMQQQQMAQAQARMQRDQLAAIANAMVRIENGTYGDCLDCGDTIDLRRLRARPAVAMCLECQRNREG